jgi:pimeloyl-ACP methyl ester carboxylesterase
LGENTRGGSVVFGDRRRLRWRAYGDPNGSPLLCLHGLPGSSLLFSIAHDAASDLRLRIIAPDRWGYGDTDAHPAPSFRHFAEDMGNLADHLGLGRFGVMGVSGGGPYAVSVAAHLADRVAALALVAPVGLTADADGGKLSAFHRFCFGPFARSPRAVHIAFSVFRRIMLWSPRAGVAIAMARVPPVDRRVLAAGTRERLQGVVLESLKRGPTGPAIDMQLYGRAWDVPLDRVRAPSHLWIGDQDRNVPVAAARRLSARLPGCELTELPGAGHLWVAENYAVVLRWIADKQKGAAAP